MNRNYKPDRQGRTVAQPLVNLIMWIRSTIPSRREVMAFVMSFTLAASISWVAGGSAAYTGPGDVVSFADGRLYAPTVREPAPALFDRISRGFRLLVKPFTPKHDATDFGDQAGVREQSRRAAVSFLGHHVGVPAAQTRGARINGGSSGLAWSLAALQLEQPDLFGERVFAATAVVDTRGTVGPVGSVEEKTRSAEMATTDVLFIHSTQAAEARASLREQSGHQPVVVGVVNLKQAVGMLCLLGARGPVCDRYLTVTDQRGRATIQVVLPTLDTAACTDLARLDAALRCTTHKTSVNVSARR